jgi:anti-sigma B factor antagonist
MNYTHKLQDNIAVFALEGSLLGENDRENIKNDFAAYLEKGVHHFLIDLTELKHINSTGLGIFITLYTKVKGKGGEMVISGPTTNIQNLLNITKLNTVFTVVATQADGLAHLAAGH